LSGCLNFRISAGPMMSSTTESSALTAYLNTSLPAIMTLTPQLGSSASKPTETPTGL